MIIDDDKGPLDGITFSVKDNICVEGIRMTCGSKALKGTIAPTRASSTLAIVYCLCTLDIHTCHHTCAFMHTLPHTTCPPQHNRQSKMFYNRQSKMFYDRQPKMFYDRQSKMFYDRQSKMFYDRQSKMFYEDQHIILCTFCRVASSSPYRIC